MPNKVPANLVVVSTTMDTEETTFTTTLTVQTHRLSEIDSLIKRAWAATKEQALYAATVNGSTQ